jgi:hypothetical protein
MQAQAVVVPSQIVPVEHGETPSGGRLRRLVSRTFAARGALAASLARASATARC